MLLLCIPLCTVFGIHTANATDSNVTFTTPAQVYGNFDTLVNNSTIWKQPFGVSDKGNMIYAYWIRPNESVACDINHDGKIGLADLVALALAYGGSPNGTSYQKARWNPSADLDCNGIIGLSDLVTLANNYGDKTNWSSDNPYSGICPSKVVMLDGCLHGAEYQSATLLYNLALFLSNSSDTRASNMTKSVQFFIVPIVNYDGFGPSGTRQDGKGVNLNRNFPYNWTNAGSINSTDPDYRGPSVASENETQELMNVFAKNPPSIYTSLHVDGGNLNTGSNGTYIETQWDGNTATDINRSINLWKNYTAVTSVYNLTTINEYTNTYPQNIYGSSTCDFGNSTHIPSVTLEIFCSENGTSYPSEDQLNGTMLQEIECLAQGDKDFLTGNQAQTLQIMKPLDLSETNVYVDQSTSYTSQYDTVNVNVTISNVTGLAGWQFALTWSNSKLNCTNATTYDPSSWSGSLSCDESMDNSYTSQNGQYFIAKAMTDGDTFNGTVTIASLTFYVLGFNTNTTLSLSDVQLCDSLGNSIATSATNGIVHIDNQH